MLIRFSTGNFMSFDKEVQLSMVRGRTRRHSDHIIKDPKPNGIDLLRLALVFGPNASGKSNLAKAMEFARTLIADGTQPKESIPVVSHKLKESCRQAPSHFEFEFKHKNNCYLYGFELDTDIVHTEWLYRTSTKTQKEIYERTTSKTRETLVRFGSAITWNGKEERDFLNFVAKGTRPNQLFLTESIQRNVDKFNDVYSWFEDVLHVVFPESRYPIHGMLPGTDNKMRSAVVDYLRDFDTGISDIAFTQASLEQALPNLPDELRRDILARVESGHAYDMVLSTPEHQRFFLRIGEDRSVKVFRMMTRHKMADAEELVEFDLPLESDGTQRMLDLIPALIVMSVRDAVFVFDELNRSLHPTLTRTMIEKFLASSSGRGSQMIATTHETGLLDLNMLRRDEIWFTEKDKQGATRLYSLEEFAPRYDKDIRRGYLLGRFGSIPFLRRMKTLDSANNHGR